MGDCDDPGGEVKYHEAMPAAAAIDTKRVSNRRTLHFERLDEPMEDVDQLAAAERAGSLRTLGNWTPGQILGHLASWADYSYDGIPIKVPFIARVLMRPLKRRILYKPMRTGARIPGITGGTIGIEPVPFDEGYSHFKKSFDRLKTEATALPHPLFGPMTHEEWISLHLRHSELHLSFMRSD